MIWMKVIRFISLGRVCKITVVSRFYLKILVTCGGAWEWKVITMVIMRIISLSTFTVERLSTGAGLVRRVMVKVSGQLVPSWTLEDLEVWRGLEAGCGS